MLPADSPFAPMPAPGPHPATAELRAYAAGTLPPAHEHRIEAHTLDCERCAELLEGFSMSDAPTTDRAVAELRARLQARLDQAEPTPAAGWAWPRVAAAAALLAVVGTGIWGWEQYKPATSPVVARVETAAEPAASPAAPMATAPEASAPIPAPASPAPTDYAAATPGTPHQSKRRTAPRPAPQSLGNKDWLANSARRQPGTRAAMQAQQAPDDVATMAMATTGASATQAAPAPAASGGNSREAQLARADAAPVSKSESGPPARPTADSLLTLSEMVVAPPLNKPLNKAQALPPGTAPATVPNTPMPADFAIRPAPVGGTPAFRDYLRREASQFEPEINNLRLSGIVRVAFTVEANGQLSNLKVTRGLRADYDEEALRLVCDGPKWQPGIAGGRRAPLLVEFIVPF